MANDGMLSYYPVLVFGALVVAAVGMIRPSTVSSARVIVVCVLQNDRKRYRIELNE